MKKFGLFVLAAYTLVAVGRIQEIFTFLVPLRLGYVFGLLSAGILAFGFLKGEQSRITKIKETHYIIGIFFIAGISALFSVYVGLSLNFILTDLARTFVFLFLIIFVVKDMDAVRKMTWIFVAIMWVMSFSAFGHHVDDRWSTSATYDPNDMALIIITALPFVTYFIPANKGLKRLALILTIPLLMFAYIATASRGGFLGLLAVSLLIVLKKTGKAERAPKIMFIIPLLLIMAYAATPEFWERMSTIWRGDEFNLTADFGRKQIWKRGVLMILSHPLLGVGPGCFETAMGMLYSQTLGGLAWRFTAHNSFILLGAEMGLIALGLFVFILYKNIRDMRRIQKQAKKIPGLKENAWLASALEVSLWGYIVCGFFLSQAYHATPYFITGLALAYKRNISEKFGIAFR